MDEKGQHEEDGRKNENMRQGEQRIESFKLRERPSLRRVLSDVSNPETRQTYEGAACHHGAEKKQRGGNKAVPATEGRKKLAKCE